MLKMYLEHKMDCQSEWTLMESWELESAPPDRDMSRDVAGYLMRGECSLEHGDTMRVRLVARCPTCLKIRDHDQIEHFDPESKSNPGAICVSCLRTHQARYKRNQ